MLSVIMLDVIILRVAAPERRQKINKPFKIYSSPSLCFASGVSTIKPFTCDKLVRFFAARSHHFHPSLTFDKLKSIKRFSNKCSLPAVYANVGLR